MTTITDKLVEAPMSARNLIELCRDALAEELGAWDIDPPLHHVKEAHDACVAWLTSQQAEQYGLAPLSEVSACPHCGGPIDQQPVPEAQQAEPSSGSNAAAPVVTPSDARVEAGAKALAAIWEPSWEEIAEDQKEGYRDEARAVLKAADAVSAVPDGFVLVREKATPLIREALRIGMRREVPNDELCDIRWRAAIAAAAASTGDDDEQP